jgi:hypothetical protein
MCTEPNLAVATNFVLFGAIVGTVISIVIYIVEGKIFGGIVHKPSYQLYLNLAINYFMRLTLVLYIAIVIAFFISPLFLPDIISSCMSPFVEAA